MSSFKSTIFAYLSRHFLMLILVLSFAMTLAPIGRVLAESNTGSPSIVIDQSQKTSLAQNLIDHTKLAWPWYLIRGSGLVATALLFMLIISGIGLITGATFKYFDPIVAWATHRALGIGFSISIALHLIGLYIDKFLPFSISEIVIPFKTTYKSTKIFGTNVGSLWVALGILAVYFTIFIMLSSLLAINRKPKLWRLVHYLSYLVLITVFLHGLFIGTDLKSGVFRIFWLIGGLCLTWFLLIRIRRAKTI